MLCAPRSQAKRPFHDPAEEAATKLGAVTCALELSGERTERLMQAEVDAEACLDSCQRSSSARQSSYKTQPLLERQLSRRAADAHCGNGTLRG